MRKTIFAIAAAVMLMPIQGPNAKELGDAAWHKKFDNCLLTDNRGVNHDGEEFCIKSDKGMSEAQIDAFYRREGEKAAAPFIAKMTPGYENCWREIEDANRLGSWTGPPSAEDCMQWAKDLQAKGRAMIDKGLKELMEANEAIGQSWGKEDRPRR